MDANNWKFSATDRYCNKDGHLVDWELSINTAQVTDVAALNKKVYVMAVDERATGTKHYSSATAACTVDSAVSVYNKPSYQMDIVPYITKLETSLSQYYRSEGSVYSRTAL